MVESEKTASTDTKKRQLSAVQLAQRQAAALKHSLYTDASNGTRLRSRKVAKMVRKERARMPWLSDADIPMLQVWCETKMLHDLVWHQLYEGGVVGRTGQPKRLLAELDRLGSTLTRIRSALPKPPETPPFDGDYQIPIGLIRQIMADADAGTPEAAVIEAESILTEGGQS